MAATIHMVVARFEGPATAREAMVDLEGRGIDADAINLLGEPASIPTAEGGLHTDLEVSKHFAESYALNGIIGAVIGAAIFIAALVLIGVRPIGTAVLLGLLAGAIGGFLMGGFIGAARHLPVNEDALETYEIDPRDPEAVTVEVRLTDPTQAAQAVRVLRRHNPLHIERRAA
jgi:hypothetical protein